VNETNRSFKLKFTLPEDPAAGQQARASKLAEPLNEFNAASSNKGVIHHEGNEEHEVVSERSADIPVRVFQPAG
jgi:hypothetical protein